MFFVTTMRPIILFILFPVVASFSKPNVNWNYCESSDDPGNFLLKVKTVVIVTR